MLEKTRYFKVACRYFSYLSLFDARDVAEIMQKLGFKPVAKLPPPEFGERIGMAGYIAEIDRNLIYVDTDKQVFRVVSFDFVDIPNSLNTLKLIVNEVNARYNVLPDFYELAWELTIETDKNVLEIFQKQSQKISLLNDINSELVLNFALFGIRLFSGTPNSPKWFDIRIEPNLSRNGMGYHIGVIYRDKDWSEFSEQVMKTPDIIKKLIEHIENV
ncbi:hypothetical protein [Archaeoglobus sp.]